MEIRVYSATEVRKGNSMSKGPDLSAFPIPRKGSAKPIVIDTASGETSTEVQRGGEGGYLQEAIPMRGQESPKPRPVNAPTRNTEPPRDPKAEGISHPSPPPSGQIVATTVKLDENRYLRLADAGKPGPGRLKRRTIQEMVVEALDEWFERRGI